MVIKIYISGISGNKEVKKRQQRVLLILDSKNVKYEIIDIAEPGAEEAKDFMQTNSTSLGATIGDPTPRHALPPQIFNEDVYCGDYDMFDMANEIDEMEVFLKLEPNSLNEQISTFETKLKNGDLSINEKIDKVIGATIYDNETEQSEQDKKDDKIETEKQEDNKKGGSVEKEGSAEKEIDTKEESGENKENKEGSAEKEVVTKEGSEEKDVENKEVTNEDKIISEDKSEKNENEDSGADIYKVDENDDKKYNEEIEELEKEASPEKSE